MIRSVEDCKRRALALASKLGVEIPGDSPSTFWMLPILEALAARIESGEKTSACPDEVCEASKVDGVLCAEDECDRESGVRPADTRPAPP